MFPAFAVSRRLALAAFFALASTAAAQTTPDSSGFDALDADIRASVLPDDLYRSQLEDAWDRAVVARRFGRADSIAVLAERLIVDTTGLPPGQVVWPGLGDRLAISLLQGDVAAVERLTDADGWRGSEAGRPFPLPMTHATRRRRPTTWLSLRLSTANVLAQDSAQVAARLAASGADPLAVAVGRLTTRRLLVAPEWSASLRDPALTREQTALNRDADAFLARFPGSRFEPFVRTVIRVRYRVDGAVSFYLGIGSGWGAGTLGEATSYSVAGEMGVGVRYRWLHADAGFHGTDLQIAETRVAGGETVHAGDRLTLALVGVDVGPRLALGGLDVLPYVAGGLLIQGTTGPNTRTPEGSTYEPPERLGWGYGVSLEYLGGRARRFGGVAVRVRAGRLVPRLDDRLGLNDPVTYVSAGLTLTGVVRRRTD